jgi:hypothetical protein
MTGTHLRKVGVVMIALGVFLALTYLVAPVQFLFTYLRLLPVPLQIGFGVAGLGLFLLLVSLLSDRWNDREEDASLKD